MKSIFDKVCDADRNFGLFKGCRKILVGLSGGADSCCLVRVLCTLSEKYGFKVGALHVNHGIRGKEADRDEAFSENLCKELGIEFICVRADIPSLAKEQGTSLELCARNKRYEIFEEVCKKNSYDAVAVAHNACDNAETVLFNLSRGSSLKGLCGIPPKRFLCDGIFIVRPLIYVTRDEIEEYLKDCGASFVTDSSNLSDDYTRNFIRHNILPSLRQLNPSLEDAVSRLTSSLRLDGEYLDGIAEKNVSDKLSELSKLDRCILSRVLVKLFEKACAEMPECKHIDALCDKIYEAVNKPDIRTSISFPGKVRANLGDGILSFTKDTRTKPQIKEYCIKLSEGFNVIDETDFAVHISFFKNDNILQTITHKGENIYKKYTTDYLYSDTIPDSLCAVSRKDGSTILSHGMNKSVKKLMSDAKVPLCDRYVLPLITENDKLILLPGIVKCDLFGNNANKCCTTVVIYRKNK